MARFPIGRKKATTLVGICCCIAFHVLIVDGVAGWAGAALISWMAALRCTCASRRSATNRNPSSSFILGKGELAQGSSGTLSNRMRFSTMTIRAEAQCPTTL